MTAVDAAKTKHPTNISTQNPPNGLPGERRGQLSHGAEVFCKYERRAAAVRANDHVNALAYNLEGVKELKLSREAYVGIFLSVPVLLGRRKTIHMTPLDREQPRRARCIIGSLLGSFPLFARRF